MTIPPTSETALLLLFLGLSFVTGAPRIGTLNLLPLQLYPYARCIDGSAGGYYHSPGTDPAKTMIYLQEGGMCMCCGGDRCPAQFDCCLRAKGALGSSVYWPTTHPLGHEWVTDNVHFMSNQPPTLFENATVVVVPYCNGDNHAGTRTEATNDTFGLYFSGRHIFSAVVQDLLSRHGLERTEEVLLTGQSAGGLGTFLNLDHLSENLLASKHIRITGLPIAGYFVDVEGFPGSHFSWHDPSVVHLWGEAMEPSCVAKHSNELYKCAIAPYQPAEVKTPYFVVEYQYDTNQIFSIDGAPLQGQNITPASSTYMQEVFGPYMSTSLINLVNPHRNHRGVFAPACTGHRMQLNETVLDGRTVDMAFSCWYTNQRGEQDCSAIDNPAWPFRNDDGRVHGSCNGHGYN